MNSTNIACKSAVTLAFHLLNRSFQAQALVIGEWVSVTVLGPSRHGSGEGVPGLLVRLDDPDTDDVSVPDDGHHLRLTPKANSSIRTFSNPTPQSDPRSGMLAGDALA